MMNGYYQYRSLDKIKFMSPEDVDLPQVDKRDSKDDLLDMIFCVDPITNMPTGSLSMYLSEKTNQQVREFIENTLMRELPDTATSVPLNMREELLKLDSSFIADCCRRRDESLEQYESRIESKFKALEDEETKKALTKKWLEQVKKNQFKD